MQTIPLSPIDHVFTGRGSYPIEFVFAYRSALDEQRLRASLARTLEAFAPAASRIVPQADGALAFEPCGDGCVFDVAASDARFDEAVDRSVFLDPVDTALGEPVTRIRLTRTPDGSVLGVSMSHAVVDGFSYFHFLASWSRVFRGEPIVPPSHQRELLIPRCEAPPEVVTTAHLHDGSGLFWDEPRPELARSALRWARHLLPRERLDALLDEAQRDSPAVRLSHNDAVAAWLWRTYVPQWTGDTPGGPTFVSAPVDHRRLLAGFPPAYFGCAVVLASASIESARLAAAPLGELAQRVRAAVGAIDAARVDRALRVVDALRRGAGVAAMEACHVVHPRSGLLVTNLSRLPVPEVAFDAGPPVAFDILTPAERGAVVLPAPAGGVDVRVCLPGPVASEPRRKE